MGNAFGERKNREGMNCAWGTENLSINAAGNSKRCEEISCSKAYRTADVSLVQLYEYSKLKYFNNKKIIFTIRGKTFLTKLRK